MVKPLRSLEELKKIIEKIEKGLRDKGLTYIEISFVITELYGRHLAARTGLVLKPYFEEMTRDILEGYEKRIKKERKN